jgi:AmmeMemoRadiSam system protein B
MTSLLPRLRMNLDLMPSPLADRPGLLIRDPYRYSDVTAVIPPVLVSGLQLFDGRHAMSDLQDMIFSMTGSPKAGEIAESLVEALRSAGFLDDETYRARKTGRHREFAAATVRTPAHAGSAYPSGIDPLRDWLVDFLGAGAGPPPPAGGGDPIAIAAPHVSPSGGQRSYAAAYRSLPESHADRTFIVLGTSHYGAPEKFGLTRKPFETPLGATSPDANLIDGLISAGGDAVEVEDYCHSVEHSIEFQVLFLQHLFGPRVRVVPILCGPFGRSLLSGGKPEDDPGVARFLGVLGDVAARESGRLAWVLGVDMAHVGRRYGDSFPAKAHVDEMDRVGERDRRRIDCVIRGDAGGFWSLVQENRDDLRWCGSAPIYTFMKAVPDARGTLLEYEQWNIDEESVVTFAGMVFGAR